MTLEGTDPVTALKFAAKIGVNLDYRDKAVRSAFNHSEVDIDYSTGVFDKQNAWFWLGECAAGQGGNAVAVGSVAWREVSAKQLTAAAEYLTRKGVKRDVIDAQGRTWTDVVPPEIVAKIPTKFHC